MKKKHVIAAAAIGVVAMLLAGCTGGPDQKKDNGPVNLTMTIYSGDPEVIATYEAIADDFRKINPRLGEFTVDTIASDSYVPALMTRIRGGDSPDLGWMQEAYVPGLATSGTLADITDQLSNSETYNISDVLPNALEVVKRGDRIYGHPFANTAYGVFYNATMFADAGVDTPLELFESGDWSWDSLARISRELVKSGKAQYGFDIPTFQYARLSLLTPVLSGFGATAWPEGKSCGLDTPEAVDAFTYWHSLLWDDHSYPRPGEKSDFASGNVGMVMSAPSLLNTLDASKFDVEMVPQPAGVPGSKPYFGQSALVAFAGGADPELAGDLIAFIGNKENSEKLAKFYIPARTSLLTPEVIAGANPKLTPEGAKRVFIDPLFEASQIDYPLAYPELEALVRPVLDGVWLQSANIPEVLKKVCERANKVLG